MGIPYAESYPFEITRASLDRGQQRYDIFCSVCHDRVGNGNGMIVRQGFPQPPTLHSARLRNAPVGYFFDVISHGFGAMPDYASEITPTDRWRIIAYMRALQRSQNASLSDVPAEKKGDLERGTSSR